MTKRKRIIVLISVFVVVAVLVAGGVCFGVSWCKKYNYVFEIKDTLAKGHGKKAKVVILAGQSNASGCSLNEYLQRNVTPEKYAEYQNGYDNVYINYYSSGNNVSNGFVKTSVNQGENENCFGPEVGLAEKLSQTYPDQLFFIIKFAWGGTNLFSQWLSPSGDGKTGNLYRNFVRYVKKSMRYLSSKGYDVSIEGMCWMQGESDSFSTDNAIGYETHLKNLIKDVRRDFSRYAAKDGIGFVDACIADNPVYWVYCDEVNASKRAVAASSDRIALIDTNAWGLACDKEPEGAPDMPHYDSLSQIKLGNLFAEEVSRFF